MKSCYQFRRCEGNDESLRCKPGLQEYFMPFGVLFLLYIIDILSKTSAHGKCTELNLLSSNKLVRFNLF